MQEEVPEVAELALVCRLACKASKVEVQALVVGSAASGVQDGASVVHKTDIKCLSLGAGNEHIKGVFVHIALHLGLGWCKKD